METLVLQWMQEHRNLAVLLVPLLAFAESCIGIGLFVSGIFLVVVCSVIHANAIAPLELMLGLAFIAATLGDHVGYYTGRWIGPGIHHLKFVVKHRDKLQRAEDMIRKRGWMAIMIGRFIPAIRSLIPLALGVSEFDRLRYTLIDIAACLLWTLGLGLIVAGAIRL